jgi:hypothetical protein
MGLGLQIQTCCRLQGNNDGSMLAQGAPLLPGAKVRVHQQDLLHLRLRWT